MMVSIPTSSLAQHQWQDIHPELIAALGAAMQHITQSHLSPDRRSLTAKTYHSAFQAFRAWAEQNGNSVPMLAVLEEWRDEQVRAGVATSTINTRLSAMRKLLNTTADSIIDLTWKMVLRDWAKVKSAKEIHSQDAIEEDYGLRLTVAQVQQIFAMIGTANIKALRDRAVVALGVGAGLRVSELVALTVRDVFHTQNKGSYGIRIRLAKHRKARIVVLGPSGSWVLRYVRDYCDAIGLNTAAPSDERVIRGVRKGRAKTYSSYGKGLSKRQVQDLLTGYSITTETGASLVARPHDLRRTYAKLSFDAGMSISALRDQLGHLSNKQTEEYVGITTDWSAREMKWTPE